MNYEVVKAHLSSIKAGDTIKHNGRMMTVCRGDINRGFMGITIFGDCYRLGREPVMKVNIIKAVDAAQQTQGGGDATD